jgi:1-acyl-sn-glycerol-3-phosphate acyltransferase
MFFRRIHIVGADHLPTDGQPLLVACNHQNTMIDPLQVIFALRPRRACIFARASIFSNKWTGLFMRWIGALPAYRMRTDGENALPHNKDSFAEAGDRMMKGEAVVIFPESYHQDKHHLGDFSLGYLRMAFETAERYHFEQDISILPMAHHYSSYFGARYEVQLSTGTPIPLSPYYEAYKAKPRTTQRNVNALVREQIEQMMVDVHDEPHYLAIDYIRRSYADTYARQHGLNPDRYADRTRAEQQLIVLLENAYRNDENGTRKTYQLAEDIRQKENINRLDDKDFEQCTGLLCRP